MGLETTIGSLEKGKQGDVIVIRLNGLHTTPHKSDIVSALVYSAQPFDVETSLSPAA